MGEYATAHANDVSDYVGVGISVGVGSRVTDNTVARLTGGRPDLPLRPPTLDPGDRGGSEKPNSRVSIPPKASLPPWINQTPQFGPPPPTTDLVPAYDPSDMMEDASNPQGGQPQAPFPFHVVSESKGIGIEADAGSTIARNTVFDGVTGISAESGSTVVHNTTRIHFVGISVDCPAAIIGNTFTGNINHDVLTSLPAARCMQSQNAKP